MSTCLLCKGYEWVMSESTMRAVPCPQCKGGEAGMRMRRLRQICRVPARYSDANILEFGSDMADRLRSRIIESRRQQVFVTVWGNYGVGKTHLLASIVNESIGEGLAAVYATMGEVFDHMRRAYASDVPEEADLFWQNLMRADILCLDEVDRIRDTDWTRDRMFVLLNSRYNATNGLTVFATNRRFGEGDALFAETPGALESRLRERNGYNLIIPLGGVDRRQQPQRSVVIQPSL